MSEHFDVSERGNLLTFTPKTTELCSNVYLVNGDTFIDLGNPEYTRELADNLIGQGIYLKTIKRIFLTHLHFDHVGDSTLFTNAEVYATPESIASLKENPERELWLSYTRDGRNDGQAGKGFQQNLEDGKISIRPLDEALQNLTYSKETLKSHQASGGGYFLMQGHTPGSCAIVLSKGIFIGDAYGHRKAPTATNNSHKKRFISFIRNYCVQIFKGHDEKGC
ncbi:MAG: MBL fold metallo-hydrolase [Nanoarchaeota archaeon]